METVPAEAEGRSRPFWLGRARLYCPPHGGPIRIGLPVGHPARPDAPVAPVGLTTIDRVPLPVRGWPPMPRAHACALSRRVVRTDGRALRGPRIGRNRYSDKTGCVAVIGAILAETRKGMAIQEADRWPAGCPIHLNATWRTLLNGARWRQACVAAHPVSACRWQLPFTSQIINLHPYSALVPASAPTQPTFMNRCWLRDA